MHHNDEDEVTHDGLLDRITMDPMNEGGAPAIRHPRIKVSDIQNEMRHGYSTDRVLAAYPDLETEDIKAALAYAEHLVKREARRPVAVS